VAVQSGQQVVAGTQIGLTGSSGYSIRAVARDSLGIEGSDDSGANFKIKKRKP
jgi:septal ring factor EnvC (AmiA/AmiB activator)